MPSSNDNIANAINLGDAYGYGTHTTATYDSTTNTTEAGEPYSSTSGLRSAWWRFTPAVDGALRVNRGATTSSTGYFALFSGPVGATIGDLTDVWGDYVLAGQTPSHGVPVTAGTTYYIQAGYSNNATHSWVFDFGARPVNDAWANAITVPVTLDGGPSQPVAVDGEFAVPRSAGLDPYVWYRVTPPSSGVLEFTQGGYATGYTEVHGDSTGPVPGQYTKLRDEIVSNSNPLDPPQWVEGGATYYIKIGKPYTPTFRPTLELGTRPANDLFDQAATLDMSTGSTSTVVSTQFCLGPESGETGLPAPRSRWYRYVPLTSGTLTATKSAATGSTMYTNIYSGTTLGGLTSLQTNRSSGWTQAVTAGTTYYMQIGYKLGQATYTYSGPASAAPAQSIPVGRATSSHTAQVATPDQAAAPQAFVLDWSETSLGGEAVVSYGPGVLLDYAERPSGATAALSLTPNRGNGLNALIAEFSVSTTDTATLTFAYKTSTESSFDFLRVDVDGSNVFSVAGDTPWTTHPGLTLTGAGAHTIRFRYTKDGSSQGGQDRVWVALMQVTNATTSATATEVPVSFDLEDGLIPSVATTSTWTNSTSEPITGTRSLRSPAVPSADGSYDLSVTKPATTGYGVLSFDWRVSSEAFSDRLQVFPVAGATNVPVSGRQMDGVGIDPGWFTHTGEASGRVCFILPAAESTVLVRYAKDSSQNTGSDAAWVDTLRVTGAGVTTTPQSVPVGRASSTTVAQVVTAALGALQVAVGRAVATTVAQVVSVSSGALQVAVGRATTTNTARVVTPPATGTVAAVRASASATTGTGTATSLTVTIPATAVVGDMLTLLGSVGAINTTVVTGPAGWTQQHNTNLGTTHAGNVHMGVWTKVCQAGDPGSSVGITVSTASNMALSVAACSGVSAVGPTTSHTYGNTTTDAPLLPGVTTTDPNTLLLGVVAVRASAIGSVREFTPPAGWVEHVDRHSDTTTERRCGVGMFAKQQAVAGATGDATVTMNATAYAMSATVAMVPAGGPGPVSVPVGRASSTTVANPVTPITGGAPVSVPVGRASSTTVAQVATPTPGPVQVPVGRTTTTHTARPATVTTPSSGVVFRAVTQVNTTVAATSHSITIPATTQVGDALLLAVGARRPMTTPTGWTLVRDSLLYSTNQWHAYLLTRTAQAGDAGSSVTLALTASEHVGAVLAAYGGVTSTPTTAVYSNDPTSNSFGKFAPTNTPGVNDTRLVGLFAGVQWTQTAATVVHTFPEDATQRAGNTSQTICAVAVADVERDTGAGSTMDFSTATTGRYTAFSVLLEPVVVATPQSVVVGQAPGTDTARPVTLLQGPGPLEADTDTGNRVGGRVRAGVAVATWDPPVTAPPASSAPALAYDTASAMGPVSVTGAQPSYTVTTARAVRLRDRIIVGGVDVTFFRGVPTPLPAYQLIMPLLYGPATLVLPQIAGCFEQLGAGDLRWLRKGAKVKVQRVDPETGAVVATDYVGVVVAFNVDGRNLSVEVGGEASGRAALRNRQPPLWHSTRDAGAIAYDSIRLLGLRFRPRLGPDTGIALASWGGLSHLDYINELCAKAQDREGNQWTILPDTSGTYRFTRKDTTTVAATVYLDDAWSVGQLRRDIAEEPNRIYMTGVNPQGRRVRGAVYPGLNQGNRPPYPFTNQATTFGEGTTNTDTDTGDGIAVMVSRLWAMKYLDRADFPGGYDRDARIAVKHLQEDAGLPATGVMDYQTWRALFDLSATGYSLRGSHIEPLAQRSKVKPWKLTSSGAKLARNPNYDPTVLRVDLNVDAGVGFKGSQLRDWARAELRGEDAWVGTITLNTGAVIDGLHNPGDPLTEAQVLPARSLRPGMNLWAPQFMGGVLLHVSGVSVAESGVVSLSVDTRARDTMKVWEVIQRNRETRHNPARAWIAQHRSSTMTNDNVAEWDAAGGVIDQVACTGGKWTVFPVVAGQEGTIRSVRFRTKAPAEYVVAIFGRSVTPAWLSGLVPRPLTAPSGKNKNDNARAWESERVRSRLDNRFLLYAAGTDEQPCGYFPGKKTNEDGDPTGHRLTGRHEDDAGVSYHTFREPVLYVAVYTDRDTTLQEGRVMWNQLEAGA